MWECVIVWWGWPRGQRTPFFYWERGRGKTQNVFIGYIFSFWQFHRVCVFIKSKISAIICSLDVVVVAEMFLKLLHELTRSNVSWQVFQSFVCDQCMLIKLKPARMWNPIFSGVVGPVENSKEQQLLCGGCDSLILHFMWFFSHLVLIFFVANLKLQDIFRDSISIIAHFL